MVYSYVIVYGYMLFSLFFLMEKNLAMWKMFSHSQPSTRVKFSRPLEFFREKKRAKQSQDVISFNATLSSCNRAQQWQMTMSLYDELLKRHEMQMDVTSFKVLAESCVTWDVEKPGSFIQLTPWGGGYLEDGIRGLVNS